MTDIGVLQTVLITVEIVLGAVAIIIALGAFLSFSWLNKQTQRIARKAALDTVNKFVKESNIKEMLEHYVRIEADQIYKDMERSPGHDLNELREKETKK